VVREKTPTRALAVWAGCSVWIDVPIKFDSIAIMNLEEGRTEDCHEGGIPLLGLHHDLATSEV